MTTTPPLPRRHGDWVLTKPHWSAPWQARHATSGETRNTGEHHYDRAIETLPVTLPVVDQEQRPGYTPGARMTIAPKRTTASPRGWM